MLNIQEDIERQKEKLQSYIGEGLGKKNSALDQMRSQDPKSTSRQSKNTKLTSMALSMIVGVRDQAKKVGLEKECESDMQKLKKLLMKLGQKTGF